MAREQKPEAIDTRWVFRGYAVVAGAAGWLLLVWGPGWFGGRADAAQIRGLGAVAIALGCCAAGFAGVENPLSRRRGLFWFAAAHGAIWFSYRAIIREISVAWFVALPALFFYLWHTWEGEPVRGTVASLFGGAGPDTNEMLRSQYERQIREAGRQEERNRLARDLHDSIRQQIFVIGTAAATAQARFETDRAGAAEALEQIRGAAREAMTEMQAMLDQLHAVPLTNAGLIEALKRQCEALEFRTGAKVEFGAGSLPPSEDLPPGAQESMLRVAQETLANVGRHARARNVAVSLRATRGQVELRIKDDGVGFDTNRSARGQGLANMRARAEEFGGVFEVVSLSGKGTSVAFSFPYPVVETPREYRRKAIGAGAALVFAALFVSFRGSLVMGAVAAASAAGVVRYLLAYRRARRRQSEASR